MLRERLGRIPRSLEDEQLWFCGLCFAHLHLGVSLCPTQLRLLYGLFAVKSMKNNREEMSSVSLICSSESPLGTIPEASAPRDSVWTFCVSLSSSMAKILLNVTEIESIA